MVDIVDEPMSEQNSLLALNVSNSEILNKENEDLSVLEMLSSLALPLNSERNVSKVIGKDKTMLEVDISIKGPEGGYLSSAHHNVIHVLFNFLVDEYVNAAITRFDKLDFSKLNIDTIYPSNADILKWANLKRGSNNLVNRYLNELQEIDLTAIERVWAASEEKMKPLFNKGKIIQNISKALVEKNVDGNKKKIYARSIRLHPFFMKQAKGASFFLVKNENLRKLSGKEKRLYIYFLARKVIYGDKFIVEAQTVGEVGAIKTGHRVRELVRRELEKIAAKINEFSYEFIYEKDEFGKKMLMVVINLQDRHVEDHKIDFYQNLLDYYGEDFIQEEPIALSRFSYEQMYREFCKTGSEMRDDLDVPTGRDTRANIVEYIVDIALFQIRDGALIRKSFKAYARSLLMSFLQDNLNVPGKYRKFITERLEYEKQMAKQRELDRLSQEKHEKEKIEQQRYDDSFNKQYSVMIKEDREFRELVTKEATKRMEDNCKKSQTSVLPELNNIFLETMKHAVAREMFDRGDMYSHVDPEKADIHLGYEHRHMKKINSVDQASLLL
jgi:hypothetical protein